MAAWLQFPEWSVACKHSRARKAHLAFLLMAAGPMQPRLLEHCKSVAVGGHVVAPLQRGYVPAGPVQPRLLEHRESVIAVDQVAISSAEFGEFQRE
jgi:hypothetical protein